MTRSDGARACRPAPLGALALVGAACLLGAGAAREKPAKPGKGGEAGFVHLGDLQAEVTALQVLHALGPTPAQARALRAAAAKTMQPPPPRKLIKVSAGYQKALTAVRDALVEGDDEKIDKAQAALDSLNEKEQPEAPDEVEISDEARARAPALLRRFSARQVVAYVGGIDDFPDPVERLVEAMAEARKIDRKEWPALRDDVAFQVGWLVGGLDATAEEKARDGAAALLNKAARLDRKDLEAQREALEREARALVGKLGPTDVLRHYMERALAEALSNHRFEAALRLRKR